MKKISNQSGLSLLEMIIGVAIGGVLIMGSLSLFKMVSTTETKYEKIMELDDLIASLGTHLMKATNGIQISYLDPKYTFYDIIDTEDINSKLAIAGVVDMNIFRVGEAFYSPTLPVPLTDPKELWELNIKPIRLTPDYFRNSFTLKYTNKVGRVQLLASRCIDPTDYDKEFTKDEVIDLPNVPHIYKSPGTMTGRSKFVRCCPIDADFPNCPANNLLPRIFHITSYDTVKMFPKPSHLNFSYDAAFGIYMKSAFNPTSFYLRFNMNVNECDSKTLSNKPLTNCNQKSTRKFIEIKRPLHSSNLSGGSI